MKEVFEEKSNSIEDYIAIITYQRDSNMTEILSKIADVRIIWGGDNTVNEIRKAQLKPRAIEVTFADRYSLCVLDAEKVLEITDLPKLEISIMTRIYMTKMHVPHHV